MADKEGKIGPAPQPISAAGCCCSWLRPSVWTRWSAGLTGRTWRLRHRNADGRQGRQDRSRSAADLGGGLLLQLAAALGLDKMVGGADRKDVAAPPPKR